MITLRKYFLWSSHWFCDFNYYNLLFEDIKITNYLQSIFSALKYPTSNFIIKRYFYKIIVQSTFYILFFYKQRLKRNKLFYYFRKHKRYLINHFLLKKSAYFLFKKISNKIYFFFFKFRRFKINYFKQFYVNVPIIDYKNMSSYSFFCNLNWNVNRLFFFKLINMQHALSIKPCFLTIFKLKNDLSHLYLNNIKACYYNSLYVYIDVFFSKHYWFSKCFNFIGKNSALLKKIKNKFNFFKSNIYDYFYKNNIDISSIHKRDTFFTDHSSENIQLKKKMNININNINNQNSINKQTFSSTIVNIYDYSLSYLFNNNLNKAFMLDLFKREKYFLIYTFLITNNYIVFNNNNFFNSSNYFVWYFFIHKYHLHFYNKLHYYVSENNFSYKYSRIYYYYSLIGYRINKLSFFLGFYKITLRDFSIKKIIDLILGINLKFDNNITSINLFNCKNTIIRKYDHHFRSLIGLINYTKILSNSTPIKTSSLIDSKKKIYKIAKKRYKKEYKNVPFMGFNNIIKKLYFYNKKKRLIEKKLIHFIIKKKKIRFDNSYLFNNYTSIFISYNNIKIGKNTFSISNNYRVNKFRIQIIKLNNKINILKKLNKYVSSKHININLFTYNKKNKLRLTFLDKQYMYINNSNISLRWFDFYHHYLYYTNKVHNMKSLFDMRMSVKSKSVNLDNQYKNIKKVNRNIFNNTRKYYSTLLYRKKRRNLLKRLLKRNKNNYLYSLSNDTIDLKKNSKYSKPIYYNNQNNFSRVQYYHIYKNYRYYFKKWYHSKKNIESFNSFRNLISHISKNVNIKKNINTRKKNRKENNYTNTKIRDYKNNRRETTFNKNRISNNQSTDNIRTNVSNPINNTNNLLYIYSNYIIYNLIFKKKFHLVYNNIYLNKYILLSRWSSIKCINFIIGNYFINKNKNSLLLSILKKTMSFLHSKINACKLIHLKKRYFVLSPIRFNYFSTLLWFSFMINNFDIISIVKESKIDNNIFTWSKYMCHMSFLNDYLLSSSIFYIFSKSTKNNYINKVLNVYIDNKIVNRFIVLKKKINNRLKRVKYKFYYIANNNTENNFSFTSTKTHTNEIYKSLHTNNVGINFFLYNKMYKLYYSVNKSFISQDIMLYNRLLDLILMVLKTLKYYSYIYAKNIFLFSLPLDLFNQLISFSNSIFSYSTNVVRLISIFYNNYYIYFEKVFSIDYLNTSILRSLLKNKSYYLYYTKYYLLNFLYLIYYIEISISEYSNNNCFLFINYSLRLKYYSNSAKMWCEYIAYYLRKKFKIWKLFWLIKKQQRIEKNKILYDFSSDRRDNIFLHSYKYPLRGIRITYSGNLKKAKRKRKLYYYVWLSDSRYTGKMPLKKFKYYIDYYSISVPLKRSSIGIKFWLLFDIH